MAARNAPGRPCNRGGRQPSGTTLAIGRWHKTTAKTIIFPPSQDRTAKTPSQKSTLRDYVTACVRSSSKKRDTLFCAGALHEVLFAKENVERYSLRDRRFGSRAPCPNPLRRPGSRIDSESVSRSRHPTSRRNRTGSRPHRRRHHHPRCYRYCRRRRRRRCRRCRR